MSTSPHRSVGVLVPAAGRGERLGVGEAGAGMAGVGVVKALRLLAGEPLLLHAVRSLRAAPSVGPLVVAAPPADVEAVTDLLAGMGVAVVAGGADRQDSVGRALAVLPADVEHVLVHDAARCLVPPVVVEAVVGALRAGARAVVPVVQVADTVKQVDGAGTVIRTVPRADLRAAQTPQGFDREVLVAGYRQGAPGATDDAGLAEALGVAVMTVPGSPEAFKVTGPLDLLLAEGVLRDRG